MKKTLLAIALSTSVGTVSAATMTSATFTMLDAGGGGVGVSPRFPNIAYFFLNIGKSLASADPPDLLIFGPADCLPDRIMASS